MALLGRGSAGTPRRRCELGNVEWSASQPPRRSEKPGPDGRTQRRNHSEGGPGREAGRERLRFCYIWLKDKPNVYDAYDVAIALGYSYKSLDWGRRLEYHRGNPRSLLLNHGNYGCEPRRASCEWFGVAIANNLPLRWAENASDSTFLARAYSRAPGIS